MSTRPATASITHVRPIIGMEVHIELSTRTKCFTRVENVAHTDNHDANANTLIDPITLALPGALPVLNRAAVDLSIRMGLAMGCSINRTSVWDRKSYFYPDLPKAYQISQYDLPICGPGVMRIHDEAGKHVVDAQIIRAHLEEDAGKLMHEAPGGQPIDFSIVDLNRAGTPLLEIVTEPCFATADEAVLYSQALRRLARFIGVTEGVMQRGHMRFEPNINCELTLDDGSTVRTPITEVKNLNSFRALRGAIDYEIKQQPKRFAENGRTHGMGTKATRGWDDARGVTTPQREKEDAHDYRYFPDPDLPPVTVDDAWLARVASEFGELPAARQSRYANDFGLKPKEIAALLEEREVADYFEAVVAAMREIASELTPERAGRLAGNAVLQTLAKLANERGMHASDLGVTPTQAAAVQVMRESGEINSNAADELFEVIAGDEGTVDPRSIAEARGLLIVRDDGALEAWCEQVIAANPQIAEQIRGGKQQAIGRLIGEVMKLAGGAADAKAVRGALMDKLNA